MNTSLGLGMRKSSPDLRRRVLFVTALALVLDLILAWASNWLKGMYFVAIAARYGIAIAMLLWLTRVAGSSADFGLRLSPAQPWRLWIRRMLLIGVGAAATVALSTWLVVHFGVQSADRFLWKFSNPSRFWADWVLEAGLVYPSLEELFYRGVLCSVLVATVDTRAAILLSTIAFAALHFAYGIAEPLNVLGGAFLAWAFLRSETLLIPFILHAAGNVSMGLFHLILTYWG